VAVVEAVLGRVGHQVSVAGRYNQAIYRGEKTAALTHWAAYVSDIVANRASKVVTLHTS
jgi:hypothetical protein